MSRSALHRTVQGSACFILLFAVGLAGPLAVAQTTTSTPQGAGLLAQALTAAGGTKALGAISDFTATGTITYFWAGKQVQGSATILGRGSDQFRLDASLPQGTRSYAVSHGAGGLKDSTGKTTSIPIHNTLNVGVLTFPFPGILARLSDPTTTISYLGLTANPAGTKLYQVRAQRQFAALADPDGKLSDMTATYYYIDPATNLPASMMDWTHPVEDAGQIYVHEIDYENYSSVGGLQVPMLVREKVGGQKIWELRLSAISFNVGLTESNFTL